jgi:hypothetical protein
MRTTFKIYDEENPIIWDKFESYALALINKGVEKYGAKSIVEVIRFHFHVEGKPIQVNNNFTADYARKFVAKYPLYSNFFEFRRLHKQ